MYSVYDRALNEIGDDNKYQKRFDVIYHLIFMVFWAMAYMNIILALTITPHECKIPEKPKNISDIEWKIINIPSKEDIKGELKFDSCLIYANSYKNNETKACLEYTYDKTWFEKTVPSEYNWVCDKELYVANIIAYSKIGEVVGSFFFGWFSDVYGRRYTYIISIITLFIGRSMTLVVGNSYVLFSIICLIGFLPSWTAPFTLSAICIEMSSSKRRVAIARLRFISYSVGLVIMSLTYWWIRDWKIFIIVTTLPLLPFVIMSWKMIESPRWLYSQGRVKESLTILKKIAKVNNKNIEADTIRDILITKTVDKSQVFGVLKLFSTRRLALNVISLLVICVFVSLSYTQLLLSSGEKTDGNPFLDFAWQATMEIPSVFIGAWLVDRIGRRYTGMLSIGVTAFTWTSMVIRESSTGGWIRKWWVSSVFSMLARLSTTVAFYLLNLLNMELYPTCLRQTGLALFTVINGLGSSVIPYVMFLGRRYDPRIPALILIVVSLTGVLASFILPETLNAKLPETLEEAQYFGCKNKSYKLKELKPLRQDQHNA
ncbi:unnamed protein product [Euphydryas editha]|uniref:Major facilitator superfamily (MFS) profile domain-containing protein n=1 Tax=Euphydryas editha TaxID=104508 RepID=A0AAU9TGX7_EUPED|nr:unnamed protein product [Euphydryas editha]